MPKTLSPVLALVLATLCAAQDEAQQKAEAFTRFRAWSPLRQLATLLDVERKVAADPDELVQRIVRRARAAADYPEITGARWFEPADWNEPGAPTRRPVKSNDAAWKTQRETMPELVFLPDLRKRVVYDWREGRIAQRKKPLTPEERCANLLHGFVPGSDAAIAQVLEALDKDPRTRTLGKYFEHCYADLNARAFEGITLYEAWASGASINMPDIDVIAFNQWVLDDASLHSPIAPADSAPVFEQMGKAAVEFRKHRTLREAVAAAFVRQEPRLDAKYAPLVPRCHFLWARLGDVEAIGELFALEPDRDAIVEQVDAEVLRSEAAMQVRDRMGAGLLAMQKRVTGAMLEAIGR